MEPPRAVAAAAPPRHAQPASDSDSDDDSGTSSTDSTADLQEETAEVLVADALASLRRHTEQRVVRRGSAALTETQWATLAELTEETMGNARALSTRHGYSTVLNRFQDFDRSNRGAATWRRTPMAHKIVAWLESQRQRVELRLTDSRGRTYRKDLSTPSAHAYFKKLQKVFRGSRFFDPAGQTYLAEYRTSLVRAGARVPLAQAPPAQPVQVAAARGVARSLSMRFQITVMWPVTGRTEDARLLVNKNIGFDRTGPRPRVVFRWPSGVKNTRMDVVDVVEMAPSEADELERYLQGLAPEAHPFPHSAEAVTRLLREVDRTLSSHSIKRGAIQALLRAGHPLHCVSNKAKHSSLAVTRTYVGPVAWAELHRSIEMSRSLQIPV